MSTCPSYLTIPTMEMGYVQKFYFGKKNFYRDRGNVFKDKGSQISAAHKTKIDLTGSLKLDNKLN